MKIKLHYVHPNNYGNLMMASAFIENFIKLNKNKKIEFYVDNINEDELKRLKNSLNSNANIKTESANKEDKKNFPLLRKISKVIVLFNQIKYNQNNYDVHIYLGGDCISEYYGTKQFIIDAIKMKLISKKNKVFLLGQTIGPFSSYRTIIAKNCLKNCYISTRDDNCFYYLKKNLKLNNIFQSRDLAFLNIPHQNDEIIRKKVFDKFECYGEYITLVASGLIKSYTDNEENYINEHVKVIENIINNTKYNVLLLAHVIHNPKSDDTRAIRGIMNKISKEYKDRIIVVDKLILPHEARMLLGNGIATITGRMHAAVSSLNMGIIPICLSYSVKYEGVIGNGFNLKDLILECNNEFIWEKGMVSKIINDKVKYVLENRESIEKNIIEKLKSTQIKALQQIEKVANNINS